MGCRTPLGGHRGKPLGLDRQIIQIKPRTRSSGDGRSRPSARFGGIGI